MDGNKDEALKCLKIGRDALGAGDQPRALKFISKARRLDPSLDVDALLSELGGESSSSRERERDSSSAQNSGVCDEGEGSSKKDPIGIPSLRKRGSASGSGSASSADYTPEQIAIVRQIKKQKDYYEILGVEKNCSVEEVRKAYRKLSLKVHPDKNKAPGAEDAFKAVSKAFQCLSDEENRKKYDVSGSDEVVYERAAARRGQRQQGFNGFYEADFDPDEIFRNFFYGGVPGATTQFSGFTFGTGMGPSMRTGTANHTSSNSNLRAIIQLLPILLVLLLNFLPSNEPVYSLQRTYQYNYSYKTTRGVDYFVKSNNFDQDYPPDSPKRANLELQVDREYHTIVSQNCRTELQRQYWDRRMETPYCDMLQKFREATSS